MFTKEDQKRIETPSYRESEHEEKDWYLWAVLAAMILFILLLKACPWLEYLLFGG